jgi:ABC-type multidrug transport system ATPase subunit
VTDLAIATRGLRKSYRGLRGTHVAVHGLDLDVPAGGVHGFLGPNGSGKTTTIRMLLGLLRADAGTMHIFGTPVPQRLPDVIARVGAIVESPKFFPSFTGVRNLSLLAEAIGTPRTRVGEVLEEVGLGDRGKDRFGGYSLGMKQRLAIAATLLKSPDLLIFDEPTNGLDPAGIREIRQTMRSLGDQGRTVLVSSHILSEVEQVADTVSIIGRGRVLAQGSVSAVIGDPAQGGVETSVPHEQAALAADALRAAGLSVESGPPNGAAAQLTVSGVEDPALVTRLLADRQVYVSRLVPVHRGLESVFLELTRDEGLTAPPPQNASQGEDVR